MNIALLQALDHLFTAKDNLDDAANLLEYAPWGFELTAETDKCLIKQLNEKIYTLIKEFRSHYTKTNIPVSINT